MIRVSSGVIGGGGFTETITRGYGFGVTKTSTATAEFDTVVTDLICDSLRTLSIEECPDANFVSVAAHQNTIYRLARIVKALAEQVESEMSEHTSRPMTVDVLRFAGYGDGLSAEDAALVMALYNGRTAPVEVPGDLVEFS